MESAIQPKEKSKMLTKFVRFVAALTVIVSVVGSNGVALADRGAAPSVGAHNLAASTLPSVAAQRPPRAPEPRPLDSRALTIPPASSLGVQFVHVATAANIAASGVAHATVIDHPLTNGNPSAILIVTPNYNPDNVGGTYDNHPIGVWYNAGTGTWRIFNQDLAAMPVGAAFNVIIPTAGAGVFVQTTTLANSGGETTAIDNALTNGNPNALLMVTPNYDPGGVCGCVYDNHPIGVYYSAPIGNKWTIFNQDHATMVIGASFNVFVLTAGAGIFVHTATAGNSAGNYTTIDNALTNGNPNAIVFVTPNLNPGGVLGAYENNNIGVYYSTSAHRWRIFNQDGSTAIPLNAAFNVLVLVPSSDIFVHTATTANISVGLTKIDNALTNGHPNAIVFTTPNWNPGGVGGTYENHSIGVYYVSGQWGIFNQDGATMPLNAAFNVLVPNPDTSVFVHKATAANISVDLTTIDYPLTNSKPDAIVFVTPNYDPGGACPCVPANFPIGVGYDSPTKKWVIFSQNGAPDTMPLGAAFNVYVFANYKLYLPLVLKNF